MITESVDVMFKPGLSTKETSAFLIEEINKIERSGGYIVGAEPIEEVRVKVIGRRFTVERGI